jgi:hypothetical protein
MVGHLRGTFRPQGAKTMPDKAFKEGYVAGWRSVRGADGIAAMPSRPNGAVNSAFRCGVTQGVADALRCGSAGSAASDVGADLDAWFDRALARP